MRARRRQAGMTLVEIMITLIISSIIAASTFMFFAGQQRIYETQTKVLNIQQNLWAAMEVLARYARASGAGMFECVRPANYTDPSSVTGGRARNTSPSPGPLTASLASPPAAGLRAYSASTGTQRIAPLWIVDNAADAGVVASTDILTVAFGTNASGTDTDVALSLDFGSASPANPLTLSGATSSNMFRGGEFVLLLVTPSYAYGDVPSQDRGCTMFQITNYTASTNILQHQSTVVANGMVWNPPGEAADMLVPGGYAVPNVGVRNFGSLVWVRFYIQQDATTGIPNLMMRQLHIGNDTGQVLAEGIEDLQVSFACDTGTLTTHNLTMVNGQLDEGYDDTTKASDEWWNNVPGDVLPDSTSDGFCNLPTAIRLTLVARALTPDDLINPTLTGNGPLDVENHRYTTRPTDQYRRRVMSTTVYPRNNKPL